MRGSAFILIEQGYSRLSLQERLGLGKAAAKYYIQAFRDKLRLQSIPLPPCRCGGPHNHLGYCIEKRHGCPTGIRPMPTDFVMIAPTLTRAGIMRHYQTSRPTRDRWLREAPDIKPRRIFTRSLKPGSQSSSRLRDNLYREIDRLIPLGLAEDIRADAISDIYLAVLDGTLSRDQIAEGGRKILNRVVDFCGLGRHSPVSLDIKYLDDGTTYVDSLEDEEALAAFERIFDDEDW
ncbi:hypothetical protein V6U71_05960 [Sphingopyxis sp. J-6]|uniref:hypothetical protein n=1 Tax=Sphingopyxis sp. J-6 TaxID=3122054 RepID=UPI0039842064